MLWRAKKRSDFENRVIKFLKSKGCYVVTSDKKHNGDYPNIVACVHGKFIAMAIAKSSDDIHIGRYKDLSKVYRACGTWYFIAPDIFDDFKAEISAMINDFTDKEKKYQSESAEK